VTYLEAILLGFVQGATEFIPVSSSGHLVLMPWLLGWDPPGLAFTVVVHLGTVFGVLIFIWRDWFNMAAGGVEWIRSHGRQNAHFRLLLLIVLGCIPGALAGLFLEDFVASLFESPVLSALMLLVTALLLWAGERLGRQLRQIGDMTWLDAALVGVAQMIAIIPGISRSGATITAGRTRHITRSDAARFSFLLSTPLIIGAGAVQIVELLQAGLPSEAFGPLIAGFLVALVTAYIVIRWLLNFLKTRPTTVFSIYCVVMAGASLIVSAVRGG
jgi:undecaprenyl-diphosphatase